MANRQTLHIKHLEEFKVWLIKDGWKIEEPKGFYEVLRARKEKRQFPLIVYKKDAAKQHLSLMERDMRVVRAFLKERKKSMTNADRIRAMSDEELALFLERVAASNGKILFECSKCEGFCKDCYLKWLQAESEE